MKKFNPGFIFLRYAILILIALPNLILFDLIFTPLTVYPVYFILSLFYKTSLFGLNLLVVNGLVISLIPACIALSAYYFLAVLNLTTPMPIKTRFKSLGFLFGVFLLLNILRIAIFSALAVSDSAYFSTLHELVWYIGSTIFVVLLWFAQVYIFKIKSIPAYSDFLSILKETKKKR